ncbi:hypothetical protein HYW75_04485 [Candidatus Pacearchaeota archaeon]|nr:hypothetical protein [Candidatus Pacearchaeota archaeon]
MIKEIKLRKKGEGDFGGLLTENVIYLLLLVIFAVLMFFAVNGFKNSTAIWEDYYAKELTKVIDLSHLGEEIEIDVQKATEIAKKNGFRDFREIFNFDNLKNEVCVKLKEGRKTCYFYSKEVDIIDRDLRLGVPGNVLNFRIVEVSR